MNTESKISSRPDPSESAQLPVIVVYGATAVGKTGLLASLPSDQFEIISADSRQVYRSLDIGTAKPGSSIRRRMPHHLIDVCDPTEQFTAGRFVRSADRIIGDLAAAGKCGIVAGGTGYYLKHFLFGLPEGPGSFPDVRAAIRSEFERKGPRALFSELARVDPVTAGRISENDRYRAERAVEVFRATGKPLSSYRVPSVLRNRYRPLCIHLVRPRDELYRRIDRRVGEMFSHGLVDELERVLASGCPVDAPGLRSIGYAELLEMRDDGCVTLADTQELIARNSRRYAKRQLTFVRQLPTLVEFHPEDRGGLLRAISEHLGVNRR